MPYSLLSCESLRRDRAEYVNDFFFSKVAKAVRYHGYQHISGFSKIYEKTSYQCLNV